MSISIDSTCFTGPCAIASSGSCAWTQPSSGGKKACPTRSAPLSITAAGRALRTGALAGRLTEHASSGVALSVVLEGVASCGYVQANARLVQPRQRVMS